MAAGVLNRATAPHDTWGDGCDGWQLCATAGLSVIEERMPPDTTETRHSHARAHQLFYVLEGQMQIELQGETHALSCGDSLSVAPGQPHQAMNRSAGDLRFLVISSPPARSDRLPAPAL